jgi:hypothetical protein
MIGEKSPLHSESPEKSEWMAQGYDIPCLQKSSSKLVGKNLQAGGMKTIAAMLFLLSSGLFAQQPSKPQISPFFDRLDDGPAFFVECRNTTGQTLSSGAITFREALRVDGIVVPKPRWEPVPGLRTDVAPGETWRGILALPQSNRLFIPAVKFGALLREARVLPIGEGKHTVAVQCGGVWSDEFTFYWEGDTFNSFSSPKNTN